MFSLTSTKNAIRLKVLQDKHWVKEVMYRLRILVYISLIIFVANLGKIIMKIQSSFS